MTTDLPISGEVSAWPTPGSTLASRYQIDEVIGRGGSSVIYRAKDLGLGRDVAVKLLDLRVGSADEIELRKRRFYREARLMAQLRAPSTVAMLDYGRTDDALLFLVFEYIDGTTLEELLERGPLSHDRVRSILLQVLESLREAHALGFLHRDIKPANIMLYKRLGQPDGVKVIDFGIAKAVGEEAVELTAAGRVVGTPRYIAPERMTGRVGGPSSDLFSLGLVALAALTGRPPLSHLKGVDVGRALMTEQQQLPPGLDVEDSLRGAIDRMLHIDHRQRPQTVDDVLSALGVDIAPLDQPGALASDDLIAFPIDLDPIGGTPVNELTGTTVIQSITLTTGSLPSVAAPMFDDGRSLPDELLAPTNEQPPRRRHRQEAPIPPGSTYSGGCVSDCSSCSSGSSRRGDPQPLGGLLLDRCALLHDQLDLAAHQLEVDTTIGGHRRLGFAVA